MIGVFQGEGIGPELTAAALKILCVIEECCSGEHRFLIRKGGAIGHEAIRLCGSPLSAHAIAFCEEIFAAGGAVLAGAGGDRFVYDCRRQFRLFYKLNPLIPSSAPLAARRIKDEFLRNVDILVVRENLAGVYQGTWSVERSRAGVLTAHQHFSYCEEQIDRVARVACQLAKARRQRLTVVTKPNGIPAISQLWLDSIRPRAREAEISLQELEIDYANFAIIQNPEQFDVVVTSNLFGDILADIGGLLLGARGLCYGGSFSGDGAAIYQTNHGAAFDIAGQGVANPVAHLSALAMMLAYSFGMDKQARWIFDAMDQVWRDGWRTRDLAEPDCVTLATDEMVDKIAAAIYRHAGKKTGDGRSCLNANRR